MRERVYQNQIRPFLLIRHRQGWSKKQIFSDVPCWINLADESLFLDKAIVETKAGVIIAACDLRKESEKMQ